MYLKSIEIQGFKSFANRIVFEFQNGVTGIVGPNGSGKSNVADAVRWVLGEQSAKQLRGGSMQDVIFAGTENRKAQGFAYVAITIDNADHMLKIDYDEVVVSRRLYRSGESEYKLNGTSCRLKDINELFYDTGIGKEGYSIIGQGQIDRILSGRPEERRELFDEAAGIVKFRRRKMEAVKKLEREEGNLVRITDILTELQKRVEPLRRQSEKAREYLALHDRLKLYDVNLFLVETKDLREQYARAEESRASLEQSLEDARRQSEEKREEHRALTEEVEALDRQIAEADQAIHEAEVQIEKDEGRIHLLREQIRNEEESAREDAKRLAEIEEEIGRHREEEGLCLQQLQVFEEESAKSTAAIRDAEQACRELEQKIGTISARIDELNAAIIRYLGEKAEISGESQRIRALYEGADQKRAALAARMLQTRSEESEGEEELRRKEAELREAGEQLRSEEERLGGIRRKQEANEKEITDWNRRLAEAQQAYHVTNTKLDSLKNLMERYEGYGFAIRRVMELKSRFPGIRGVVADLITTDRRYETAVETALGAQIQNIVTDNDLTAKKLIEFLKKERAGRATFLPMTSMRGRGEGLRDEIRRAEGVIGTADELVKTDPQYRDLIRQLLGRTIVADNIDHALALEKANHHSLRIVTLEGELLNPGGSITGGAFKSSSNLLGRKREMEDLETALEAALEKVEEAQLKLISAEESRITFRDAVEEAQEALGRTRLLESRLRMETEQAKKKKEEMARSFGSLTSENDSVAGELDGLLRQKKELEEKEEALEEMSADAAEKIGTLSDELESLKTQKEEADRQLAGLRTEESRMQLKGEFITQNLSRERSDLERLLRDREERAGRSEGREGRIAGRQSEIAELTQRITECGEGLAARRQEASGFRDERSGKEERKKSFFEEKERLDENVRLLDRDLVRIQNQLEKFSDKITQQTDYISSEYEMTFADAEKLRDDSLGSLPAMRKETGKLRGQIRELGSVNVSAIEEYREVSERAGFMEKQHADLMAAQAALEKIIRELDEGMRRQFREKFGEIAEEFDQVFKELFGGGKATLQLEEGVDVLEAGIGIIAQPPGKKLQNMMQLSGGEKALTAIALLFAIQNLKPSPFCLLDEIEAALDDSNVDRFAGYLHKLTRSTQFIVITHRRGTMLGCDRLYGITMQEKGVSTMVSVNLIENDLEGGNNNGRR